MSRGPISTTLIAVYMGRDLVGRCDVNCWGGEDTDRCECVCGGLNHAAGIGRAIEQTRRMHEEWIMRHREQGIIFDGVELGIQVTHDPLFPYDDEEQHAGWAAIAS